MHIDLRFQPISPVAPIAPAGPIWLENGPGFPGLPGCPSKPLGPVKSRNIHIHHVNLQKKNRCSQQWIHTILPDFLLNIIINSSLAYMIVCLFIISKWVPLSHGLS